MYSVVGASSTVWQPKDPSMVDSTTPADNRLNPDTDVMLRVECMSSRSLKVSLTPLPHLLPWACDIPVTPLLANCPPEPPVELLAGFDISGEYCTIPDHCFVDSFHCPGGHPPCCSRPQENRTHCISSGRGCLRRPAGCARLHTAAHAPPDPAASEALVRHQKPLP